MRPRRYAALVLGALLAGLVCNCTQAEQEKALADSQTAINGYCDARQKTLDALGIKGSPAVGVDAGEAGAAP